MSDLRISADLTLPSQAATWVFSYLAKRGAGKTYNAAVQAEEMLKAGIPIGVVDGMGIWWGLRVGPDGKGAGLPVVVFGGEHADLPLMAERAGELARAIVESNISFVLDLSNFSKTAARRFVSAFLDELYRLNRVDRHIFIEESDMFAPQKPFGPEENLCLSSVDNFVRRGGNHNLGCTLITQRPAVLNKNVLTQSDCLVVMRILAPQDKKAVQEWVAEKIEEDPEKLKAWYDSLKSLRNGEAYVWHPEEPVIDNQRVLFRERETFHATRESIKSPAAANVKLMDASEFIKKFKAVFQERAVPEIASAAGVFSGLQKAIDNNLQLEGELISKFKALQSEVEDFRSGRKLADSVSKRLQFLGSVKHDLEERLQQQAEELKLYDELKSVLRRMFPKGIPENPFLQSPSDNKNIFTAQLAQEIPSITIKVSKPILEADEKSWRGRLLMLVVKNYFSGARKLTPIRERLQQDYGALPNAALISNELVELVKLHFLERKQDSGQWVYYEYPKVHDRIKEAS